MAIEQEVDGLRKAISTFVPVENWRQLMPPRSDEQNVRFNLKVIVATAGLVETDSNRLIDVDSDGPRLFTIYTYPMKVWIQHNSGYFKYYPIGTPFGVSRPYPSKPFYVSPDELKQSFCVNGGYRIHQTPLSESD